MKLFVSMCQKIAKEASKKVILPKIALPVTKTVSRIEPLKLHHTFREKFVYNVFGKYLLTTNTITSGILMVIGDFAAQEIEYRRGENQLRRDWHRSGKKIMNFLFMGKIINLFFFCCCRNYVHCWCYARTNASLFLYVDRFGNKNC